MAARDFRTRLVRRAIRVGLPLTSDLASSLTAYYELLARWNRKINLTALNDPDAAIDRLLLEPVAAARHLPSGTAHLLDIGSGGGSPAIPLKLAAPGISLVMVEVKVRKSAFLREAVRQLGLDASVETSRYEELLARPEFYEAFDAVSIRAVRTEPRTLMTLQAFLRPSGTMMLFRGPGASEYEGVLVPPLEHTQTVPLVEATQSRLTLLSKTAGIVG